MSKIIFISFFFIVSIISSISRLSSYPFYCCFEHNFLTHEFSGFPLVYNIIFRFRADSNDKDSSVTANDSDQNNKDEDSSWSDSSNIDKISPQHFNFHSLYS